MKRAIRKTYKTYRSMKRSLQDPATRASIAEHTEDALGFTSMFVILFFLTVIF